MTGAAISTIVMITPMSVAFSGEMIDEVHTYMTSMMNTDIAHAASQMPAMAIPAPVESPFC